MPMGPIGNIIHDIRNEASRLLCPLKIHHGTSSAVDQRVLESPLSSPVSELSSASMREVPPQRTSSTSIPTFQSPATLTATQRPRHIGVPGPVNLIANPFGRPPALPKGLANNGRTFGNLGGAQQFPPAVTGNTDYFGNSLTQQTSNSTLTTSQLSTPEGRTEQISSGDIRGPPHTRPGR